MPFPVYTAGGVPSLSGTYVPKLFAKELLVKFYLSTVFSEIANTDYEGDISGMGDQVEIRTCPSVTIRDYIKGQPLVYEYLDPMNVSLLIDKGKYYGFNITDVDKAQSDIEMRSKWGDDAAQQLKIQIDGSILDAIPADVHASNVGSTAGLESENIDLGTTGAAASLTKSNIIDKICECSQILDEQNLPETDRWIVLPPWAIQRVKTSEIKDASLSGDGKSTVRTGRVGRVDRFTIYSSNQLKKVVDGTDKVWNILFGHKSSLTFASQFTKEELIKNPNDFGDILRGLQVYGFEVVKPDAMGRLYAKPAVDLP
ncbi:hypothetical protein [Desulfovibrio inopinatus]|uniref:phage major capsid protein n=1 Tax=Desulfovibrio inopinatus TaxID=102109 RepID=UPI00048A393C|nr:hypothetical protein [Desulfovibrio inopinatus]